MEIQALLRSHTFKLLPSFLRNSDIWGVIKRIEKPFPLIGLPNMLEKCAVDFDMKPSYIGFTSIGIQGVWDLATMSMRGVCSCMHWLNPHSHQLLGSVVDPFLGMVYITDNTMTPHGLRFIRRSLVRLIYGENNTHALLIERPYKDTGNTVPTVYNNKDPYYHTTLNVFEEFIYKHISAKYAPAAAPWTIHQHAPYRGSIPLSTGTTYALNLGHSSMRDSGITYQKIIDNDSFITQFSNQN